MPMSNAAIAMATGSANRCMVLSLLPNHEYVQASIFALNHFHRTLWQCGKKSPAVRARHNPVVQDHHDTVVALGADETADALAQFQDRFLKRVFRARVAAVRFNEFQLRL